MCAHFVKVVESETYLEGRRHFGGDEISMGRKFGPGLLLLLVLVLLLFGFLFPI